MKRLLLPVIILGACASVAYSLIRNPRQIAEVALDVIPVTVRVIEVQQSSAELIVGSQGKVQPSMTANLSAAVAGPVAWICLLYTSPSPRDGLLSRMPSSA